MKIHQKKDTFYKLWSFNETQEFFVVWNFSLFCFTHIATLGCGVLFIRFNNFPR